MSPLVSSLRATRGSDPDSYEDPRFNTPRWFAVRMDQLVRDACGLAARAALAVAHGARRPRVIRDVRIVIERELECEMFER